MALFRKNNEALNCFVNFVKDTIRRIQAIRCYVIPDFGEVCECVRVKDEPAH